MARAVALGEGVRGTTAPNPWVGAVLVTADGTAFEGRNRAATGEARRDRGA